MLNSPGNFTAAKLAWVKQNEPEIYEQIDKVMLPGDYIAMKLTNEITTSSSALSEGVFFDFQFNGLSKDIVDYFGFDDGLFPILKPVFSSHGRITTTVAAALQLTPGIPVTYKAGDQPNNALSLNVLSPGKVAATAGTLGVIYGVSDQMTYDSQSRVNTFAHVNYLNERRRLGVLLCINGTGGMYRWVKNSFAKSLTYPQMNAESGKAPTGSDGLRILPFGNGVERMLNNKQVGAHLHNIGLNLHTNAHIYRATLEGIACAFRYGMDIMRENGINPSVIKAGRNNMFLSEVFSETFVNAIGIPVELYNNDGSMGAAIGVEIFTSTAEAFANMRPLQMIEPFANDFESIY
jgi:xylulokinase